MAWLALVTWGTLRVAGGAMPEGPINPDAAHVNLLLYGLVAGLALTGAVGWWLLAPVASLWRRGGLTMVGVLAGVSVGMLATFVARELGGVPALAGLIGAGAVPAVLLARAARRAAT